MKVIVINQKPHKCPNCDVRFNNKRNIARHIKDQHSGKIRKFQCCICKKNYQTHGNWKAHYKKEHLLELCIEPESVEGKK